MPVTAFHQNKLLTYSATAFHITSNSPFNYMKPGGTDLSGKAGRGLKKLKNLLSVSKPVTT